MADRPLAGTSRANGAVKTKLMVRFAGDLGSPSTAAGHAERAAGIHATAEEYCGFIQGILPYIGPDSAVGSPCMETGALGALCTDAPLRHLQP